MKKRKWFKNNGEGSGEEGRKGKGKKKEGKGKRKGKDKEGKRKGMRIASVRRKKAGGKDSFLFPFLPLSSI